MPKKTSPNFHRTKIPRRRIYGGFSRFTIQELCDQLTCWSLLAWSHHPAVRRTNLAPIWYWSRQDQVYIRSSCQQTLLHT